MPIIYYLKSQYAILLLMKNKKYLNILFYGTVGLAGALALLLSFYYILRIDSNAGFLADSSVSTAYSLFYVALTIGTAVFFGADVALLVYRLRKYGMLELKAESGAGIGAFLGIFASACPICGSTLLSLLGVTGGLGSLPFRGLEVKTLSFLFMALPIFLIWREIKNFDCGKKVCPKPKDASYHPDKDSIYLSLAVVSIFFIIVAGWQKLKSDPLLAKIAPNYYVYAPTASAVSCQKPN